MQMIENTLPATEIVSQPAHVSSQGGFMAIIEKAAALDNIDVDKLERMMAMQLQWEDRNANKLFQEALARVSSRIGHIKVTKTRTVAYDVDKTDKAKGQKEAFKYAALEDIDKLVRPVLDEEKVTVSYDIEPCALPGWHTVVCYLSHAGHKEPYKMPMPLDTSGGKGNSQAMGSTQTYGMRRALCGALNIVPVGMDDDGAGGAITEEQAEQVKQGLKDTGLDVIKFLKRMKVESVEEIRTKDFIVALAAIENKRYMNKKEAEKNPNKTTKGD